jgi:uncharacterized transporter YbjL
MSRTRKSDALGIGSVICTITFYLSGCTFITLGVFQGDFNVAILLTAILAWFGSEVLLRMCYAVKQSPKKIDI